MSTIPTRVVGDKHNRGYKDALGHLIHVGDMVSYVTRSGSSVYINYGKVKEMVDLDRPAYLGYERPPLSAGITSARVRTESWDHAYKLKIIPYEFDRVMEQFMLPTYWDGNSHVRPQSEDDVKLRTVSAIERVHRLRV